MLLTGLGCGSGPGRTLSFIAILPPHPERHSIAQTWSYDPIV